MYGVKSSRISFARPLADYPHSRFTLIHIPVPRLLLGIRLIDQNVGFCNQLEFRSIGYEICSQLPVFPITPAALLIHLFFCSIDLHQCGLPLQSSVLLQSIPAFPNDPKIPIALTHADEFPAPPHNLPALLCASSVFGHKLFFLGTCCTFGCELSAVIVVITLPPLLLLISYIHPST